MSVSFIPADVRPNPTLHVECGWHCRVLVSAEKNPNPNGSPNPPNAPHDPHITSDVALGSVVAPHPGLHNVCLMHRVVMSLVSL